VRSILTVEIADVIGKCTCCPTSVRLNHKGDFESAIEYLQLLIEYLGESKKPDTVKMMEKIYYKLGPNAKPLGDKRLANIKN